MAGHLYTQYNPHASAGVISNAKPAVYPFPRVPTYTLGQNGHRLQPQERGNFFLRQGARAEPQGAVDTTGAGGGCKGGCANCPNKTGGC